MNTVNERLVILGLDGATWTVLDPLRRRGLTPNLDALLSNAAHGTLRSSVPPMTAAAWATMQTGCSPIRHGIFDHRYHDAASGRMKINHSGRIRVPTTWQILAQHGRSVVSLNLPGTYPAPADVSGIVVSGMDAPHLEAATSRCPEFAARLKTEVPAYTLRYHWKRVPVSLEELRQNAALTIESFRGRAEGGLLADRMRPDWSALMVQFQNLDPFQHRAWKYLNVDETGIEDRAWNDAADSVIKGLDDAVGLLLELADRRGAAVIVCSDHGFGPCLGRIHANRVLIDAGVARMPGPVGKVARRARQGIDHLRLWRDKREDPEARSASFELSVAAQFPFDWGRTLAFAPHQDTAAMVYMNRAILNTPRQLDEARNAAATALATARHPVSHSPLFPEVVCLASTYDLDPAAEGYPDLLALPDANYWVRTKIGAGKNWVESDPNLPGTHRPEGIIALSAAGVAPGRVLKANLQDVAPTVLSLLGLPIPSHMEGRPLPCLPETSKRRLDPPGNALNGPHAQPVTQPQPAVEFDYSAEDQAIIEQRLADLGYLD